MAHILLVTGGAKSGKSRYAEERCLSLSAKPIYVATAEIWDAEMAERVAEHRARRQDLWEDHPETLNLAAALDATDGRGARLVDCLTLWLTNVMLGEHDIAAHRGALLAALKRQTSPVVLVTNEVGMGIVPDNALARRFRDEAGRLNQYMAEIADEVVLVACGLPLKLKG